ncbi:MAG: HpsJ family protein, partial [Cyanobacteria bacterium]|nr:HpsJ family protein [Cyanobacteriota bacterium]
MKSSTRAPFNTSQALKICGMLLILMTIVNIVFVITLPNLPPKPTSLDTLRSQVEIVVQLVDQGFVSLLGLMVLAIGLWMDSITETTRSQRKFWRAVGIVIFLLASLMALMYLIITPLHLSNAQLARQQTLERIEQEVTLAETQLNNRINTELQQQQGRINLLMQASDEQLKQAIASGQVSNEQAALIEQFKKDPKSLEQFLKKEDERIRGQAQVEISTRKATAEKQAQLENLKTGLRVG